MTDRLDNLIQEIREIHKDKMHGEKPADILLVAHGHLLRAFTKRWLGYPMEFPLSLMLDPGAVGVLRYFSPILSCLLIIADLDSAVTSITALMSLLCWLDTDTHCRTKLIRLGRVQFSI